MNDSPHRVQTSSAVTTAARSTHAFQEMSPPELGERAAEILQELVFNDTEIAIFKAH